MSFPTTLPTDAINTIVGIVEDPSTFDKAAFGLALYELEGYFLGQFIGNPVTAQADDSKVTGTQVVAHLKSLAHPSASSVTAMKLGDGSILKWITGAFQTFLHSAGGQALVQALLGMILGKIGVPAPTAP